MKHDFVTMRRVMCSVAAASAAFMHAGCGFTKTVEFRHHDTQRLIDGATPSQVAEEWRVGSGAIGMLLVPTDAGFQVELAVFFEDSHERLGVRSVSILSPDVGSGDGATLVEATWRALDPKIANALGSLAIAEIRNPVAQAIYDSDMDIVLQVLLQVGTEERLLSFHFERIAEWWPPNV